MNNNEIFNEAFGNVDLKYIENTARAPKRKPVLLMRIVPIAAAVAILMSGVIAVFSMANRNKPEVPGADEPIVVPPVVDTEPEQPEHTNTILDLPIIDPTIADKPNFLFGGMVGFSPYSYYLKKGKICFDVRYFLAPQAADNYANISIPYMTGFTPTFIVYNVIEASESKNIVPLINGSTEYIKKFPRSEETPYLSYKFIEESKQEYVPTEYIEFDFSEVPTGATGKVVIGFVWVNDETNEAKNGELEPLYYYVGDNGVGFSFRSVENAKNNLFKIESGGSEKEEPTRLIPIELENALEKKKTGDGSASLNNP